MTDSDDAISRRYREGAREEPPASLDAAILAASRRAVQAGPRRNRWAMPVSIAAVLVLGIGVSLRMQMEQPGIETSVPSSSSAEYPMPQATEASPPVTPSPPSAADATTQAPAPRAKEPPKALARADAPAAMQKRIKPADLPPEAAPAAKPEAPAPAPFTDLAAQSAPAPAAAPARMQGGIASPVPGARREASVALQGAAAVAKDPREAELERIARLRAEGNHDEADKALEAFRREHPQYRIPDAMRERIERR
jgi:hypothetical protein